MNEGIHLDLDTWIVPGQIRKANLCQGLGNRYTPAGTEVLISTIAHNTPPPFQAAQNATTVNTRSSVAPLTVYVKFNSLCTVNHLYCRPLYSAVGDPPLGLFCFGAEFHPCTHFSAYFMCLF